MEKSTFNTNDCENEMLPCIDTTSDGSKIDQHNLQKCLNFAEAMLAMRKENLDLKNQLLLSEQKSRDLQSDIQVLMTLVRNAGQSLNSTRSSLLSLIDDLAQLCAVNGETPNRNLLDRRNDDPSFDNDSLSDMRPQLKSDIFISRPHVYEDLLALSDAVEIKKNVDMISDQIRHIKTVVDHTIELNKNKVSDVAVRDKDAKEEIFKLKSLLSIKCEQVATLRTVLKSNMDTAEVALTNLKSKYENEKRISRETISLLQDKLKILKEDAATSSSIRAIFVVRCEEYGTQVDDLTRKLSTVEAEKNTLYQFLQLEIRQKLELASKLEMDK